MARTQSTTSQPLASSLGKLTVVLTQDNVTLLKALAQEASEQGKRTISGSAILRALIQYAAQQGRGWQREHILPLLEEEIAGGTVWGTKK
jgi:hypothetical protein